MKGKVGKLTAAFLTLASVMMTDAQGAASGDQFDPFRQSSKHELLAMQYDDLSYILKRTVFDAGRSDRSYAPPPSPGVGRHFVRGNASPTRLEGNRLYFIAFQQEDNLHALHRIRRELEAMPGAVPMVEWTKTQQLAYWLNLYNVTLIERMMRDYPVTNVRKLLYGAGGLLDEKLLTVAGVELSLNDIHHRILIPNWQDPLIMYGLFHGYVGSPNIRKEAYTAQNVYEMLRENAAEFINSNRGMVRDGAGLRVAELYAINRALFPKWPTDLKRHLEAFASVDYVPTVRNADVIRPDADDYYIADLFQGVTHDINPNEGNVAGIVTSLPGLGSGEAGMLADFIIATSRTASGFNFPPHVQEYVIDIREKFSRREGKVEVEEYDEPTTTTTPEEAPQP